ncbi:hypothetical protein SAMN06264849_103144 [Melghirimyces algeriensis]|uniref:Uncharacterized protein n=1 Tax=Melghirimyces algeriensis TaxID=910412 RepID=A0A521C7C8_9BACL|nr:hypothetical protein SAMN06264849_103144 [Melghirimyces algeriensis]
MADDWEPCPRCGSNKTQTLGKSLWVTIALLFVGATLFVGIIIWPALILAPVFLLISLIILVLPIPKVNTCRYCKFNWKVKKAEKAS